MMLPPAWVTGPPGRPGGRALEFEDHLAHVDFGHDHGLDALGQRAEEGLGKGQATLSLITPALIPFLALAGGPAGERALMP